MKKTITIAAVLLCSLLFSSCLKYHSCNCSATYNGKYTPLDAGGIQGSLDHAKQKCAHDVKAKYEAAGFQDVVCYVPE